MFKTNDEMMEDNNFEQKSLEDTVIGSSIKIEGDIKSKGNIVVDGEVIGSLQTDSNLRIGESAKIQANVEAGEVIIAGEVNGNVKARDKVELQSTAKLQGDIVSQTLVIATGAVFNGRCEMGSVNQSQSAVNAASYENTDSESNSQDNSEANQEESSADN